jgi:cell fate regulator YaaT (PSP1 superfamily)
MPGTITPLPVMLEEEDRKLYDQLEPPKTIVVRYGYLKLVAELPYDGKDKPGCGSKLVVRTSRGIELGEMLTTTCANSGCGKSVTRKQMLEYIENSGGKDYPFSTQGKVLRVAMNEDLLEQQRLDGQQSKMIQFTKALVRELDLSMRLVDLELLLGGERMIFHYTSDQWVDFRELVRRLAQEYQTRIEMHQVNARDEARLVADYEKCGQYCCCKQFLKVLKPVSMKSAKVQKATLDPTKISGRCGRLMCCLRYEDQTYSELKKRLPHRQTRVMTEDGAGTVIGSQILTQLVLVLLDTTNTQSAFPLENIEKLTKENDPANQPKVVEPKASSPGQQRPNRDRRERPAQEKQQPRQETREPPTQPPKQTSGESATQESGDKPKRRRRRRRGGNSGGGSS